MAATRNYRAPALQKGLEILELLALSPVPMMAVDISAALGRSVSELFRMVQELEKHGYIARSGEGYRVTNRLFLLGMAQPPIQDLLGHALPAMRDLAAQSRQSCHLAMASGSEMIVVANVEAPGLLGFAVRMGYRRPLIHSASGHVLMAFQSETDLDQMLNATEDAKLSFDRKALMRRLVKARNAGYITMASPMLTAITDLSSPILQNDVGLAALTMPFVDGPGATLGRDDALLALKNAARKISSGLAVAS
jgi:DNA-binding IclR family transcriptional regulator